MSVEKAKDKVEKVAGAARARMGDMTQKERSQAEQAMKRDEKRDKQPGEHVQEDAQDARNTS